MKSFAIALGVTVASTVAAADVQAKTRRAGPSGPAVTIGSLDTKMAQDDCMALGTKIMRSSGLTQNFEVVGKTVYGETEDYTGAIRCDAPHGIVVFFVAGPLSKRTESIHQKLKDAFGSSQPN